MDATCVTSASGVFGRGDLLNDKEPFETTLSKRSLGVPRTGHNNRISIRSSESGSFRQAVPRPRLHKGNSP